MKQKDIAIIIVIAFLSGLVSLFLASKIFVTPENRQQEVEVIDEISTTFILPDERYFNSESINPTIDSEIGTSTNENPFNGQ